MHALGAVLSLLLSANFNHLDRLKQRLQLGYDAATEARSLIAGQNYKQAAASFSEALNLGRKPTLALQEMELEDDALSDLKAESLDWLIGVCCESSLLQLNYLEDADRSRADAWAACVFSKYQSKRALECMMQVCRHGRDLFGEFQTCKQMLNLPDAELGDAGAMKALEERLGELEKALSNKS